MEFKTLPEFREMSIGPELSSTVKASKVFLPETGEKMFLKQIPMTNGVLRREENFNIILGDFLTLGMDHFPSVCVPSYWFYDSVKEEMYLFYPLLEGDLFDWSIQVPTVKERFSIVKMMFSPLIRGLKFLVNHGIYHQDVKLENIGYRQTRRGYQLFYLDFGFCQHLPYIGEDRNIDSFARRGTKEVLAPEFYLGAFVKETPFYSLYLSFYHFLFRRCPPKNRPLDFEMGYWEYKEINRDDESRLDREKRQFLVYLTALSQSSPYYRIPQNVKTFTGKAWPEAIYRSGTREESQTMFDGVCFWMVKEFVTPYCHDFFLALDIIARLAAKRPLRIKDYHTTMILIRALNGESGYHLEPKMASRIFRLLQRLDYHVYHEEQGYSFFSLTHLSIPFIIDKVNSWKGELDLFNRPLWKLETILDEFISYKEKWIDPRKSNPRFLAQYYPKKLSRWGIYDQKSTEKSSSS